MSFIPRLIAFLALAMSSVPTLAIAQAETAAKPAPDPTSPAGRQAEGLARYERGAQAYANGRYKDAIDLFLQADALSPSAPLSFNIARASEKIGDHAGALQWYRDYRRRAPSAPNASAVDELIRNLEAELAKRGVQQLTVLSSPLGATVVIDGQPMGVTPFTGQFSPGTHNILVSLRGYRDSERKAELSAERAQEVVVPLVPDTRQPNGPAAVPPDATPTTDEPSRAPAESPPAAPPPGPRFGIWPWISLGVGAAALGGAGTFELLRRGTEEDAKADETQVGYNDKYEGMKSRQTTARVLGIVGGVFAVTGGVLLIFNRPPHNRESAKLQLDCDPSGCAVEVKGRF